MIVVVNSCYGPSHTDAQKHIYCITTCHITHTCVRVFVLDGCYFTGECIWEQTERLYLCSSMDVIVFCLEFHNRQKLATSCYLLTKLNRFVFTGVRESHTNILCFHLFYIYARLAYYWKLQPNFFRIKKYLKCRSAYVQLVN